MISFSFMALFLIHVLIHKFIDSNSKSPQDSLTLFYPLVTSFIVARKVLFSLILYVI